MVTIIGHILALFCGKIRQTNPQPCFLSNISDNGGGLESLSQFYQSVLLATEWVFPVSRRTPLMESGITNLIWTMDEIARLTE